MTRPQTPGGTRYYAAIVQRTLTAAYKKADYFAKRPHRLACASCPFYVPKDNYHPCPTPRGHPHPRPAQPRESLERPAASSH
jgi:hypothetical protein